MALMIPDRCPSKASQGEKRLFRLLQDILPDDFTVWYEPVIQGRYPDFTVLSDTFGLLLLEVKGWYLKHIRAASDRLVELEPREGETVVEKVQNPIRQARDYTFRLVDMLKREPLLRSAEGDYQGKLCFPYGFGVLFANISRSNLEEARLDALFPPEQTICRDELAALETAQEDRHTIRRMKRLFPVDFPFEPLTTDQVRLIHGTLHREVVLRSTAATTQSVPPTVSLPPGARTLEVLDAKQERVAKSIGDGHRVFFGVAGSGKTVLLVARARLMAEEDRSRKILLLCYNRALATYLRAHLLDQGEVASVQVHTFHGWASRTTGLQKMPDESFGAYEGRLIEQLGRTLEGGLAATKYDAILIDEAHDFQPEWLRCCVLALRDPVSGDLLVAVDGAQSLYGRPRSFTWKSVGIQAVGRSRRLSTNYRNTRETLQFAWEVAQAPLDADQETETHIRVEPTHALRTGPPPAYRACRGIEEEHDVIHRIVTKLIEGGVPDREICVLYAREESGRIARLHRQLARSTPVCWMTDERNRSARDTYIRQSGVRLCTVHSAKGLEFRVVVFSSLDQLPDARNKDLVRDSNLFYVGLTRAMECLIVTWARPSRFAQRVAASDHAVLLDV